MAERAPISLLRLLVVMVPIAILGLGAYVWSTTWEMAERSRMSENVFAGILSANSMAARQSMAFEDRDGDLVADPPQDPDECIDPEVLVFSFVAGEAESVPQDAWDEVLAALREKSGREVAYLHHSSVDEQLDAIENGELHITGLNTGVVPTAVQQVGFVPLCTFGSDDESYGHTMRLIVPADSPVQELHDIKHRKVMFTRPDSNSGCKAMLMVLRDYAELLPDRDYTWGFSRSHEESIRGVASGEYEAAPVASDILDRMIDQGEVDPASIRTVYESERFPPATIGYVYNLAPELRAAIREALVGMDLTGTGLEGQFGRDANKLVEVDYKNDWANIRHIEQLAAQARSDR